jgi:hypothetical protein
MGGPYMHMQAQAGYYYPNPYGWVIQCLWIFIVCNLAGILT